MNDTRLRGPVGNPHVTFDSPQNWVVSWGLWGTGSRTPCRCWNWPCGPSGASTTLQVLSENPRVGVAVRSQPVSFEGLKDNVTDRAAACPALWPPWAARRTHSHARELREKAANPKSPPNPVMFPRGHWAARTCPPQGPAPSWGPGGRAVCTGAVSGGRSTVTSSPRRGAGGARTRTRPPSFPGC